MDASLLKLHKKGVEKFDNCEDVLCYDPSMLVGLFKHPRAGLKKYFLRGPSHLSSREYWFQRCVNLPPIRMRNSPYLGSTSILDKISFARPRSTVQTGVQKPIKGLLIQEGYRTHRVVVILGEVRFCCASFNTIFPFKMVSFISILNRAWPTSGSKVVRASGMQIHATSGALFIPDMQKLSISCQ